VAVITDFNAGEGDRVRFEGPQPKLLWTSVPLAVDFSPVTAGLTPSVVVLALDYNDDQLADGYLIVTNQPLHELAGNGGAEAGQELIRYLSSLVDQARPDGDIRLVLEPSTTLDGYIF
jgi:hypothetical protein